MSHVTVKDASRDYHRKAQQNVRLSDDGRAALRALSAFYGIGISDVIEMLVRERIHEKQLRVSSLLKTVNKRPPKKR